LEAQRFRALQKVNDLKVIEHGNLAERPLTDDERKAVFAKLEEEGDQSLAELRKLLGLKKAEFNLERGGEKRLWGNRTNSFMRSVFGVFWDEMPEEEKHKAVTLGTELSQRRSSHRRCANAGRSTRTQPRSSSKRGRKKDIAVCL